MNPEVKWHLDGLSPYVEIKCPRTDITESMMDTFNNGYKKILEHVEQDARVQLLSKQAKKINKQENTIRSLEGEIKFTRAQMDHKERHIHKGTGKLLAEYKELVEQLQEKDAIIKNLEEAASTGSIGELALAFERELMDKENSNKQLREENKALKTILEVQNTVASELKNHTQKMAFIKQVIDSECTFDLNDRLIKLENY